MRNKMAISMKYLIRIDLGKKKKQINTLEIPIFVDYFRNFFYRVLWYAECDGVIFVKILWLLGGVAPYFPK